MNKEAFLIILEVFPSLQSFGTLWETYICHYIHPWDNLTDREP